MSTRGSAGGGATEGAATIPGGKSLILLRTMAAATSHVNVIRHTQDARKKRQSILTLVGYAVLGVLGSGMIGATAFGMAYSEYARMVPVMAAAAVSVMTLIFTMLKSNGYLYAFKDYDLLMSLPFSVRTIVSTRFLLMYLKDLPWSLLISLAALVGYALGARPALWACVTWLVLTPVIPLVPTVIAALFGVLIARIGSRSRYKTLIQIILTFLFIIPLFFIQYVVRYLVQNDQVDTVLASTAQSLSGFSTVFPTIGWFERAVCDGDLLSIVLLVVVSLALYLAFVMVVSAHYRRINSRLTSMGGRHSAKVGTRAYQRRSVVRSVAFKEFKRITGSTVCATNLGLGAVLCLLVSVILPFVDLSSFATTMAKGAPVDLSILTLVWPVGVYFFVGMVPTTVPSPSLEGKNAWIIKSLPLDGMSVCKGRMLFNLCMNLVPGLLATVVGLVALRASWLELLLGLLMMCAMCLFSTVYGMYCGLKHQRLDWEMEVEVVKQGAAVMLYLLPNLFATMAISGFMVAAGIFGFAQVAAVGLIVVYGVLAWLSYRSVQQLAR